MTTDKLKRVFKFYLLWAALYLGVILVVAITGMIYTTVAIVFGPK